MINRALGRVAGAVHAAWDASQRHRTLGAMARLLKHHTMEIIAVLCLLALVLAVNPAALGGVFARTDVALVLLMLPVTIGTYLARSLGWWFTLRRVGVDVDIPHSVAVEFAGQTMVFMPTGDLARIALIKEVTGTPRTSGELTATIAFQELLFMTLMGLGVLPRVARHPDIALLVIAMVLIHLLILTVIIWKPAYDWAIGLVEKVKLLRRFDSQLRSIRPAFVELLHLRVVVPVLLCNALAVFLSYLLFYLALHAVGANQVSFIAAMFVLALSFVISGISLIPGGVGLFEGLLTVLVIANGVPVAAGAAAGLLFRGFNDVLMAGMGAVFLVLIRRGHLHEAPSRRRGAASGETSTARSSAGTPRESQEARRA
ncbi:MAG: flippase-like domain-containing protein [Candidatus Dormibacteraeota bacterium]|uniref:Flippase-like domain-containing protein n=1 Tax=Candidatus Amunia macphersoniae TaxID=3127014 RepID=A0A934NDS0_9BACT|nr:flippase-like domain-containing protein [Candidatus Dormibacteraeota bacterium]